MKTPLLERSQLPFGAFPFDRLQSDQYIGALREAIQIGKSNIAKIQDIEIERAGFENVIVALETASELVGQVQTVFFNLLNAHSSEEMHKMAAQIGPLLSEYENDITLDSKIFSLVKKVFDSQQNLRLSVEQKMLLKKTYIHFKRNGALLDEEKKATLRSIDSELAQLAPKFEENLLKSTNEFKLWLDSEADLEGLPESFCTAAREAAQAAGDASKWLITLHYPSYVPFMTYSAKRALREQIYRVYGARAMGQITDNRPLMKRTAELRHQRANLLGYKTHAHFVLEERMAETPEKVFGFLQTLLEKSRSAGERDLGDVQRFYQNQTGKSDFMQWDYLYYSEKLKLATLNFDDETLRPYFQLERVIDGLFLHATKLFGLRFKELSGLPTYHPDVKVYEVQDETSQHVGLFYTDLFPRPEKRSGAWMTSFRDQGLQNGKIERPHVSIVCNLTRPTGDQPSLLTFEEVQTLFHEFGHALHGLLSKVHYTSLSGTHVYWDFVELPSQIMENWTLHKEALDLFAAHYKTKEKIPADLAAKILQSKKFQAGYSFLRQIGLSLLDMSWHSQDPSQISDVVSFEREALKKTSLLPPLDGLMTSPSFSHIFAGGYSAGYYSYKWAEVLDADAFEYIKSKGLFDPQLSKKFKAEILERGGSEPPQELYRRFRGQEPDPEALLRRCGLV